MPRPISLFSVTGCPPVRPAQIRCFDHVSSVTVIDADPSCRDLTIGDQDTIRSVDVDARVEHTRKNRPIFKECLHGRRIAQHGRSDYSGRFFQRFQPVVRLVIDIRCYNGNRRELLFTQMIVSFFKINLSP